MQPISSFVAFISLRGAFKRLPKCQMSKNHIFRNAFCGIRGGHRRSIEDGVKKCKISQKNYMLND